MNNGTNMIAFIAKLVAFAMAAFRILPANGKIANRMTDIIYNWPGLINVYQNMIATNQYKEQMQQYISDKPSLIGQPTDLKYQKS